jgi:hypothetical protein
MFLLAWEPSVRDTPLYQRDDGVSDSACVFSRRIRELGFRAGYTILHNFRAEDLHLIGMFLTYQFSRVSSQLNIRLDKLYSSTQRRQHGAHTSEDTYGNFYARRKPGTDGQNSYLGDKPRTIINDLLRAMTLSRNSKLWQSLPAKKQHEL